MQWNSTSTERGILPRKGQKEVYTPPEIQKTWRLDIHANAGTIPVKSWWKCVRKRTASPGGVEIPIQRGFQVSITADCEAM